MTETTALEEENSALRERVIEMEQRINVLGEENERLRVSLVNSGAADPGRKWIRGKLPGEKLIKVDAATGAFEEIGREEWESLR